jgi:hypothetical protein
MTKQEKAEAELLKYEIAKELGLDDKIRKGGWKCLSSKESGKIGGLLANKRRAALQKKSAAQNEQPTD